MGKCIVCKKKGLFLKVNENGRCKECEKEYQQQLIAIEESKKEKALIKYHEYADKFRYLKESIDLSADLIERADIIPQIEKKIEECDRLAETVEEARSDKYFEEIVKEQCDYTSKSDRILQYAYFEAYDLQILIHSYEKNVVLMDKFVTGLKEELFQTKRYWNKVIHQIQTGAKFEQLMRSIPAVHIHLSDNTYSKLSISELDESVKYSKITARTNYSRIGNFVVVDVETTGLSSIKNEIIEVSAIKFEDWTPVAKFQSLVKPKKEITAEITQITGITNEMVEGCPMFSSLIPALSEFVGKSSLVGYNLPFDLKFLYRSGYDFTTEKRKYYDVLEIAKSILKKPRMKWDKELKSYEINYDHNFDVEDYKLTTVCQYYDIRDNSSAHRATSDALATGMVFMKLAQEKIVEI